MLRFQSLIITICTLVVLAAWPVAGAFPTPSLNYQPPVDAWSAPKTDEPATSIVSPALIDADNKASSLTPSATTPVEQVPLVFDPLAQYLSAVDAPNVRYEIIINLPSLRLLLYERGQVIRDYPIAAGNIVSQSLLGTTHIINKVSNPTYYPPNWGSRGLKPIPPGPDNPVGTFWMGLEWKGYGIHGTNAPSSIGTAKSAGCIRMYNADVEALGRIVPINTPVSFVYDVVTLWRNKDTLEPLTAIYPDIYDLGMPSLVEIRQMLRDSGINEPIHEEVLQYMLAMATGKPQLLPLKTEVQFGGLPPVAGYYQGDQVLVSLAHLSEILGLPLEILSPNEATIAGLKMPNAWTWHQLAFAPIDASTVLQLMETVY